MPDFANQVGNIFTLCRLGTSIRYQLDAAVSDELPAEMQALLKKLALVEPQRSRGSVEG